MRSPEEEEQGPPAPPPAAPIIIIKKVAAHGGHHGGAWKVAYADFVTAMMALFIVLWLLNSGQKVKEAVAGYFKDPAGVGNKAGTGDAGSGVGVEGKQDMARLSDKLQQAIKEMPEFQKIKAYVEVTLTQEGLLIELLESEKGMFFQSGNALPTEQGQELLAKLAVEMGKLPNSVLIEGHTDSKPFAGGGAYTNWELSTDRANSARRLMQSRGLRADQVAQVRGLADQRLRNKDQPTAASNRRISLTVQNLNLPESGKPQAPAPAEKSAEPKAIQEGK